MQAEHTQRRSLRERLFGEDIGERERKKTTHTGHLRQNLRGKQSLHEKKFVTQQIGQVQATTARQDGAEVSGNVRLLSRAKQGGAALRVVATSQRDWGSAAAAAGLTGGYSRCSAGRSGDKQGGGGCSSGVRGEEQLRGRQHRLPQQLGGSTDLPTSPALKGMAGGWRRSQRPREQLRGPHLFLPKKKRKQWMQTGDDGKRSGSRQCAAAARSANQRTRGV